MNSLGPERSYRISEPSDSIWIAREIREVAARVGFNLRELSSLAIVASELVSNALKFGKSGMVTVTLLRQPDGIELTVVDDGPGFADPEAAIVDGFSEGRIRSVDDRSPRGLGLGLGAVKRLTDELEITNLPGAGCRVVVRCWVPARSTPSTNRP